MEANIEKVKIGLNSPTILQIELNSYGDFVTVSADSAEFFDKFVSGYKRIVELTENIPNRLKDIEQKYHGMDDFSSSMDMALEMSRVNTDFSKEAICIINGIFGMDTIKKYFRSIYEQIPDFLPDSDCFMDFLENIAPIMEKMFGRKIERQREASMERMAKYQPQDHKKKGAR